MQERQKAAAAQLGACRLDQKGAAATRPDHLIDFMEEIVGENDMCSLVSHKKAHFYCDIIR